MVVVGHATGHWWAAQRRVLDLALVHRNQSSFVILLPVHLGGIRCARPVTVVFETRETGRIHTVNVLVSYGLGQAQLCERLLSMLVGVLLRCRTDDGETCLLLRVGHHVHVAIRVVSIGRDGTQYPLDVRIVRLSAPSEKVTTLVTILAGIVLDQFVHYAIQLGRHRIGQFKYGLQRDARWQREVGYVGQQRCPRR